MGDAELFAAVALAALSFLVVGWAAAWLYAHPTAACPLCRADNEAGDPHCRVCGCPLRDRLPRG